MWNRVDTKKWNIKMILTAVTNVIYLRDNNGPRFEPWGTFEIVIFFCPVTIVHFIL